MLRRALPSWKAKVNSVGFSSFFFANFKGRNRLSQLIVRTIVVLYVYSFEVTMLSVKKLCILFWISPVIPHRGCKRISPVPLLPKPSAISEIFLSLQTRMFSFCLWWFIKLVFIWWQHTSNEEILRQLFFIFNIDFCLAQRAGKLFLVTSWSYVLDNTLASSTIKKISKAAWLYYWIRFVYKPHNCWSVANSILYMMHLKKSLFSLSKYEF